jgi:autotransporter-associated beta strand protein
MKTSTTSIRAPLRSFRRLPGCALALAALGQLTQPTAQAANNIPIYFDTNGNTLGFYDTLPSGNYNLSTVAWSNEVTGVSALTTRNGKQWTFGLVSGGANTNFTGSTFTIIGNTGHDIQGLLINNTNNHITLGGTNQGIYLGSDQSWTVAAGSSFTEALQGVPGARGLNYSSRALTLVGGGTFNFEAPIGFNSPVGGAGKITENGDATLVVNLKAAATTITGGVDYGAGFTLTNGTLNFATAISKNAFKAFSSTAKPFAINGGILDNTSGSAMTLEVGAGGYSIGGNFTFTGSSDLNFGTAPVVLAGTPGIRQITVGDKTLTIGGIISGSGFALTKAGNGTLKLNGVNTYDGETIVSAGTFGGSGTLAGAATFEAGSKAVFTVTPGGPIGNNSSVMKITGMMTYNANEVHLNLPANLPGGAYVLAYSDATPVANGAFPIPVVDSGSYAGDVTGATITLDTVTKQLILTAETTFLGPVQLAVQVNGGANPTAGVSFDVVVQAQNGSGIATNVLTDTAVILSLDTGTGTFLPLSDTILTGHSQITFSGLNYDKAESGVVLKATRISGDSLTPGLSTAFTVTTAAVSATASTVTAYPSGVLANGTTPITITVTLLDAYNNPISGKTVALTSSRNTPDPVDTILPASAISNANGVVTFTVTSTTPGPATLGATVDPSGANLPITQTAPVTFTTSNPNLVVGEKQFSASSGAPDPGPPAPIDVASGDLLQTSVTSVTMADGFSQPEDWMRNGLFTDLNQLYQKNSNNPLAVTYALNLATHPLGYDIKEIRMFSNPYQERAGQSYDILYSLVGAPDTFILLGTVDTPANEYGVLMTRTYDSTAGATPDAGPAILTGVAKIRFNFRIVGPYGTIWREFDVTGVPTGSVPPATNYETWGNSTFANAFTDKDPASDPDGDGMTNQQEFAFGIDPTTGASANPITQQLDPATGIFKYTRWKDSGLTYKVYYSTDLSNWTWDEFAVQSAGTAVNGVETVTVTLAAAAPYGGKLFVRVEAQ